MSGIANERPVDLIISVVPGTTYATPKGDERNGKVGSGKLGIINLFTKEGSPKKETLTSAFASTTTKQAILTP